MKVKDVDYVELTDAAAGRPVMSPTISLIKHVDVTLEVKVGEVRLTVAELFALQAGSMLTLDRLVEEPVDVLLNGKVVAAGQLAVVGEYLGVRITEILNADKQLSA